MFCLHKRMRPIRTVLRSLIPLLVILAALGVSRGAVAAPCPETGAKVFLTTTEASRLAAALQRLKPKPSVICYSRENPEGEPHPAMTAVLEAIMSMRLPVRIFTDATFQRPVI
jgi:hypothetical protein